MKNSKPSRKISAINSKGTPIRVQHSWTEGFQTNENNKKQQITSELLQKKPMILKYWKRNLLLGEDFGFLPSNTWRVFGSGINTALHNQTTIFLMTLSVRGFRFFTKSAKKLRMHTNSIIELNRTAYQKTSLF
jgi:hypothetical protein